MYHHEDECPAIEAPECDQCLSMREMLLIGGFAVYGLVHLANLAIRWALGQ